jgi:hypothetical protein
MGDARSLLYVFDRGMGSYAVYASDTQTPTALPFSRADLTGHPSYALLYRCSLDRLGLVAGEQPVAGPADLKQRSLPSPFTAAYQLGPDDLGSWRQLPMLPDPITQLRLALDAPPTPPKPCVQISAKPRQLPNTESLTTLIAQPLDSEHVLASTGGNGTQVQFFLVASSSVVTLPELASSGVPNGAAFRFPDGELVLVGGSSVARAKGVSSAFAFDRSPPLLALDALSVDGTRSATSPKELFLIAQVRTSSALTLLHQDASGWSVLVPGNFPGVGRSVVTWAGLHEAFATGFRADRIVHYTPAGVVEEPVDLGGGEHFSVVRHLPGFGTIAGTNVGHLFKRNALGGWDPIPNSPLQIEIDSLAPYGNGFLAGANSSFVVEWDPVQQFCPMTALGGGTVFSIEPLGDRFVARTSNFADEMRLATVIELTLTAAAPPDDPCALP